MSLNIFSRSMAAIDLFLGFIGKQPRHMRVKAGTRRSNKHFRIRLPNRIITMDAKLWAVVFLAHVSRSMILQIFHYHQKETQSE